MKGVKITVEIGSESESYRKQETIAFSAETTIEIANWKIGEMFRMLADKNPKCWMEIKLQTIYDLENN